MTSLEIKTEHPLVDRLVAEGYWAAVAARRLEQGKFSEVVSICRTNIENDPQLVSGRIIYARALHGSGQSELAAEQFRRVLALDPNHIVALKCMGDIAFESGDVVSALAYYGRVLEIDPSCTGLKSDIKRRNPSTTRTITITRHTETKIDSAAENLREIPFYTETIGDLYLSQGYPRLAARVFRELSRQGESPRITEKLTLAESKIKERDD